jgi:hypothetical protein
MSVAEILQSVQFVVDSMGNRKAVQLDLTAWEELLSLLEDLEDAQELAELRQTDEEVVPWDQAKAELRAGGLDV